MSLGAREALGEFHSILVRRPPFINIFLAPLLGRAPPLLLPLG